MAMATQPAKKSYFFSKGDADVFNTIKGAWQRNFISLEKYKDNIADARYGGKIVFLFKLMLNVLAAISIVVFGSIITAIVSLLNIIIVLVLMVVVYIGFSIIWLVDRIYLVRKKIFTACHECKEKSLIPTYICPKCK